MIAAGLVRLRGGILGHCSLRGPDPSKRRSRPATNPYRLTGGIFSRSPANLEHARRGRVGNLYLNKRTTGAVVGRQRSVASNHRGRVEGRRPGLCEAIPESRTITENALRHGFAPET
jgi:RHH-type proline utilization regulon transcriptional repressor/proline dehydrogenase/delta 1-pyrroline-5-carboxylate dehydrogenase